MVVVISCHFSDFFSALFLALFSSICHYLSRFQCIVGISLWCQNLISSLDKHPSSGINGFVFTSIVSSIVYSLLRCSTLWCSRRFNVTSTNLCDEVRVFSAGFFGCLVVNSHFLRETALVVVAFARATIVSILSAFPTPNKQSFSLSLSLFLRFLCATGRRPAPGRGSSPLSATLFSLVNRRLAYLQKF